MARATAKPKAAAPSPAKAGKAGETKPADAALIAAEATETTAEQVAAGATPPGAPVVPVVGMPVVVATALLAMTEQAKGDTADADAIALAAAAAAASEGAAPGDADAAALAAAGADADSAGPGAEDAPSELVTALGFTLPLITEFPVVLTLTNAWQGRHDVAGTNETLAPGETRDVEFTEAGYARFSRVIVQLADLHGWTDGQGLLIEQGADHGEE